MKKLLLISFLSILIFSCEKTDVDETRQTTSNKNDAMIKSKSMLIAKSFNGVTKFETNPYELLEEINKNYVKNKKNGITFSRIEVVKGVDVEKYFLALRHSSEDYSRSLFLELEMVNDEFILVQRPNAIECELGTCCEECATNGTSCFCWDALNVPECAGVQSTCHQAS